MYKIIGYDWAELTEPLLGIKYEPPEDMLLSEYEDDISEKIKTKLAELSYISEGQEEKIKNVRKFVKLLSKNDATKRRELVKGLYRIKDDATFLKYTSILLRNLWT